MMGLELEDSTRQMTQGQGTGFFTALYNDPFQWGVVKGIAVLCLGIKFARVLRGFELMPTMPS